MKFEEDWEYDFGIQYNINRTYVFYDIENLEYFINILNDDGITYRGLVYYSEMDIKETIKRSPIYVIVCKFYYYIMESEHYKKSILSYDYPIDKFKL